MEGNQMSSTISRQRMRFSLKTVSMLPGWLLELLTGLICISITMVTMRGALWAAQTTVAHDTLLWLYPWYQYTAESLLQGRFPWWNPFTHGGEPFYPLLAQLRFFDPVSFLVLFGGSWFTDDLLTLFAWDRFTRGMICVCGAYFLLRPWAEHTLTRCSLLPILMFSSFFLSPLRQDAFLGHFIWTSFVMILTFKIVWFRDYRWSNWILLAGFIGLNWQSYYFAGTWIFLLLFIIGISVFHRQSLIQLLRQPGNAFKLAVATAIVSVMFIPNLVLLLEHDRFLLPARMVDRNLKNNSALVGTQQWEIGPGAELGSSVFMPYSHVAQTGTSSRIIDFLQMVTPHGSPFRSDAGWGKPSEAFLYFGLWVYAIALWGLLVGQHPLKRVWMVIGIGFGLLMLGPFTGLHPLLFHLYPPLWVVRHTHGLTLLFSVALLYLYVVGCNWWLKPSSLDWAWSEENWRKLAKVSIALFAIAAGFTLYTLEKETLAFLGNIYEKIRISVLSRSLLRLVLVCLILGGVQLLQQAIKDQSKKNFVLDAMLLTIVFISLAFLGRILRPQFPDTLILSAFLIGMACIVWYLRRVFGSIYVFLVLFFSHVLAVFLLHRSWNYLAFLLIVMGIPFFVWQLGRRKAGWLASEGIRYTVALVIVGDLLVYSIQSRGLWDIPRPDTILGIQPIPLEPKLAATRQLVTKTGHEASIYGQAMRYPEVMYRVPTIFTPRMASPVRLMPQDELLRQLISGRRWNSYLMLKPYYHLIYADIPITALQQVFSIGRPLLQFKSKAMHVSDQAGLKLLYALGEDKADRLLEHTVLLSDDAVDWSDGSPEMHAGQLDRELMSSLREDTSDFQWQINHYDYNTLDLTISTEQSGYLSWSDGYDRYWKAYIGDLEVPVLRANINFKAIQLTPGRYQVRFVYDPPWYRMSILVFLGTQIAVAVIAFLLWCWNRRRNSVAQPVIVQ